VIRSLIEAIGDGEEEIDMGGRKVPVRQYAGWFNFKGADQQKSVGVLSGQFQKHDLEQSSESLDSRISDDGNPV
jgi:ATPase subunit of ABC transporter with duplicated ATPase domains